MANHQSHFHEQLGSDYAPDTIDRRPDFDPADSHSLKGLLSSDSPYSPSESTAYDPYSSQPDTPHSASSTWKESPAVSVNECESKHGYRKDHGAFASVSVLLLSIYSTIFSGIWLGLAIARPHYPFIKMTGGHLSPSTASTMVAAFAKSIELSFVTIFVAFIGQALSRAALDNKGITIADMQLRSFLMQPGIILKSWQTFRMTMKTLLGVGTLLATLAAVLYTTASDALVSPKSSLKRPHIQPLMGYVQTDFANNTYIQDLCPTPISEGLDGGFAGSTCVGIEHSGQAFHNFMQYLQSWKNASGSLNDTIGVNSRPSPVGMLYDNTTVQGTWMNTSGGIVSVKNGRLLNNVTMVMPHSGVYAAALDKSNRLSEYQTGDVNGQFWANAQVVSPTINVMCAEVTEEELAPLIWSKWPNNTDKAGSVPSSYADPIPNTWYNKTSLDDVFGFNNIAGQYGGRKPPVFGKIPIKNNTVFNGGYWTTGGAVYLLVTSSFFNISSHTMCSLQMSLEPGCSTNFQFDVSGGNLSTDCSKGNSMAYEGGRKIQNTWGEVGASWGLGVSLNSGINDEDSSIGRLLTQLIPDKRTVPEDKPTLAEALAVLSGCTLMNSAIAAPFTADGAKSSLQAWDNYTTLRISDARDQSFQSEVSVAEYGSGSSSDWENLFSLVLAAVFLGSVWCLLYFIYLMRIKGLVSDFIEPENIFALALTSPPDRRLAGSSGLGPSREQLVDKWYIRENSQHQVFIGDGKKRGHSSWIPSVRRRPVASFDAGRGDGMEVVPQAYKGTVRDGFKRAVGGLGLELKAFTGRGRNGM